MGDGVVEAPEVGAEITHQPTSMAEHDCRVSSVHQRTFRKGPETTGPNGDQRREVDRHLTILAGEASKGKIKETAEYRILHQRVLQLEAEKTQLQQRVAEIPWLEKEKRRLELLTMEQDAMLRQNQAQLGKLMTERDVALANENLLCTRAGDLRDGERIANMQRFQLEAELAQ